MRPATDFDMLGRLGTADRALSGGPRRRRQSERAGTPRPARARLLKQLGLHRFRPSPMVVAGLVGLLLVLAGLGATAGGQQGVLAAVTLAEPSMDPALEATLMAGDTPQVATGAIALVPGGGSAAGSVGAPSTFAAVDDLALHLPTPGVESVLFMEADNASALPMAPVGTMTANANPEGFRELQSMAGPDYLVAAPLTGVRPATGMAALLVAPGTPLTAPVQGTVDVVEQYTTVAGDLDWRVVISPQGRTDLQIVVRGIDVPLVAPGDAVAVGQTEIGTVGATAVIQGELNPMSFPSALLLVQPAVLSPSMTPTASAVPLTTG